MVEICKLSIVQNQCCAVFLDLQDFRPGLYDVNVPTGVNKQKTLQKTYFLVTT
jgi:hypothetical protein